MKSTSPMAWASHCPPASKVCPRLSTVLRPGEARTRALVLLHQRKMPRSPDSPAPGSARDSKCDSSARKKQCVASYDAPANPREQTLVHILGHRSRRTRLDYLFERVSTTSFQLAKWYELSGTVLTVQLMTMQMLRARVRLLTPRKLAGEPPRSPCPTRPLVRPKSVAISRLSRGHFGEDILKLCEVERSCSQVRRPHSL